MKFRLYLACITFAISLSIKHSKEESKGCDFLHQTWASCRNLTSIPYQEIPKSVVVLQFTSCDFGPVLRPTQVTKLQQLFYLQSLYLTSNQFDSIEDNTFISLNNLTNLDISGNRIRVFRENALLGLEQLVYLHASDNLLNFISPGTFTKVSLLQFLDLEGNNLTYIGNAFAGLKELSTLLLANNQISQVDSNALLELTNLWHLSLFGNLLSVPRPSWFYQIISNDGTIELNHRISSQIGNQNPWICCFDMLEFRDFVISVKSSFLSYSQLDIKCSAPSYLLGRHVTTLFDEDMNSSCPKLSLKFDDRSYFIGAQLKYSEKLKNDIVVSTKHAVSSTIINSNILSKLNNVEVFLLFAFCVVFGGVFVATVSYIIRRKRNKAIEIEDCELKRSAGSQKTTFAKASTRLFRQDVPSYGVTDPVSRSQNHFWTNRQLVVPREVLTSPEVDDSIIPKSLDSLTSDFPIEVDKSEDEPWTAVKRSNSSNNS